MSEGLKFKEGRLPSGEGSVLSWYSDGHSPDTEEVSDADEA